MFNVHECIMCDKQEELVICQECFFHVRKNELIKVIQNLNIPKCIKTEIFKRLRQMSKKKKSNKIHPIEPMPEPPKPFVSIEEGCFLIEL